MNENDLKNILQIERELDIELKELSDLIWDDIPGYTLNENKQVTGLALVKCEINNLNRIISSIRDLINLRRLNLIDNKISDILPIKDLTNLTELYLSDNNISDISSINNLISLKELWLFNNQLKDIQTLGNLKYLTELALQSNQLSDISFLKDLVNLNGLSLSGNQIKNISPCENLINLTELELFENKISNISPLKKLTFFKKLWLSDNKIDDISSIKYLTLLELLYLDDNQIIDISSLKNLNNLKQLHLKNNPIRVLPIWITSFNVDIQWNELGGEGIVFYDNPLKSPPIEILQEGKLAVQDYFRNAELQVKETLNLFTNFKKDILSEIKDIEENEHIKYEFEKIENVLTEVEKAINNKKDFNITVRNYLIEFVENISNANSRMNKIVKSVSESTKKFNKFANVYNKCAYVFDLSLFPLLF